jgi:SAM-dependent methyltransferase
MYTNQIDLLIKKILSEVNRFAGEPVLNFSRDELISLYWQYHQRFKFFKTAALANGKILDIGGGTGGIFWWKEFLAPSRGDLKIFALDLYKGQFFDKLDGYHLINLDNEKIPHENESFDFIMMSHLIEHVRDWKQLIRECGRIMKPNGVIYIETPSIHTVSLPSRSFFLEKGYDCSTINFYDDNTHTEIVDLNNVDSFSESIGLLSIEKGFCKNNYLQDELISLGYRTKDPETTTYGLWSKLMFASYIVLQKL